MTVGLVACCKTKSPRSGPARGVYLSPLFGKALAYCELNYDRTFIMSAKHWLLHPDWEVEPYDKTMEDLKKQGKDFVRQWADHIDGWLRLGLRYLQPGMHPRVPDIEPLAGQHPDIFLHAGEDYCLPILELNSGLNPWANYHRPTQGRQIGEQLHWYATHPGRLKEY